MFIEQNAEEVDFYRSLTTNGNTELDSHHAHRDKRSTQDETENQVYESEVKILGHVENEARDRVTRSSGDSEYSISERPIRPKLTYDYSHTPNVHDDPNTSTNDEITVTDLSSVDSKSSDEPTVSTIDSKPSNADIGTGIEVEAEQKLSDDNPDEQQTTSQSTIEEITVSSRGDISREGKKWTLPNIPFILQLARC